MNDCSSLFFATANTAYQERQKMRRSVHDLRRSGWRREDDDKLCHVSFVYFCHCQRKRKSLGKKKETKDKQDKKTDAEKKERGIIYGVEEGEGL